MEGLLGQLIDFSYTIPVFNVTITKEIAFSYAEAHAAWGPMFALVLLILFGIIMTLIWLYLILSAACSCCCLLKKQGGGNQGEIQSSRISPQSPISRSSAPLRKDGGAPMSSSVERYDDEDAMRQTVSLARGHRRYSFSCFNITSTFLIICLGTCVAAVVVYQSKFDASARNFLGDVEELMLDSADAMCTADAGSSACTAQSTGMFVSTAETKTTGVLGSLVDFLASVEDNLFPSLNGTIDDLNSASVGLYTIEVYTDLINGNVSLIQQYLAAAQNESTPLATALPEGELPIVTAKQLMVVEEGRTAVATARSNAEELYGTITSFMATEVTEVVAEFNTSTPSGTTTQQLLDPLRQIFGSVLQGRDIALKYHAMAEEQGETYMGYMTQKTWAVTLIFFVPFLLQIILTLLNRSYSKSSGHLVVNMCCNYFCLLLFVTLAIIFSMLAIASSTICEYHLEFVAEVPVQTFTLNDVQISITPAVIEHILHCPASPFTPNGATSDNNFINIMDAESIFDISSQTGKVIAQLEDTRTSFSPEIQIQRAIDEMASLGASVELNMSDSNIYFSYRTEMLALVSDLPPAAMDRDNATQQESLARYYIVNQDFSWADYQTSLTTVNTLLVGAAPIPPGFLPVYSFQTAWNFTEATVANEPLWEDVEFTPPTVLEDLITGLSKADPFTAVVNAAVESNEEVHTNITAVLQALDDIQNNVESINAMQVNLASLETQLNSSLYDLLAHAHGITTGLMAKEESIRGLANFVSTAPEYTNCGFVGKFYQEGFQETFCGDLHDSLSTMWPFMLAASVCLFVSFVTFSCFVHKPRWFRNPDYNLWHDRNNLMPERTPREAGMLA